MEPSADPTSNYSIPLIDNEGGENVWVGFDVGSEVLEDKAPYASLEASDTSLLKILPAVTRKSIASDDSVFSSSSSSLSSTDAKTAGGDEGRRLGNYSQLEEDAYNYVFANKVG